MSRKFKVPLNLVGLTTDPGSATNGDLYFNTVSNKVRYYTQNTWQDLGAAAGGATVQVSTTIPETATEGKLWYDNDDAHLYVFDGTYWVEVSIGPVGPAGPTGAGVATAGTTGQYLVKSSNNNYETTWSTLPAASLTSTDVSRLTGATSNLQTQINTLSTNLGNTLDDYVPIGDVGQPDGVASLDSSGKIPIAQLGNLIDGAPGALDTLNELAAAINDDASYAAGVTTALGTKVSNAGGDIIASSLASTIPLRIRGAASQTANLQEWQNSAGTVLARISPAGSGLFAGGLDLSGGTGGIIGGGGLTCIILGTNRNIQIGGTTPSYGGGQSVIGITNATIVPSSNPTNGGVLYVESGALKFRGASGIGAQLEAYSATDKPLIVKGFASQTANLLEFQNSSGTAVTFFNASGGLTATEGVMSTLHSGGKSTTGTLGYFNATTFNPAVIPVVVRGVASQTANLQEWQNSAGNALSSITSFGGARLYDLGIKGGPEGIAWAYFGNNNTSTKNVVVRGFASQTASLQEWQNSAGTVLAKITPSGALDVTAITVNGSAISGGLSPVAVSTNITMVANTRYFVDTTNDLTLTLPANPALGAEIELYDASNNAFNDDVVILRNGQKINGLTEDAALDINGFTVSFIYTGSTYGWRMK